MDALEVTLVRCQSCGAVQTLPRWVCANCGGKDLSLVSGGVSGTIYSFTTIYVAPARFQEQVPYHVALVELPHGIKVTARVECEIGQALRIGMPVRLSSKDKECLWFRAVGPEERNKEA